MQQNVALGLAPPLEHDNLASSERMPRLPLGLAPSQWTPILDSLEGEYTTLVLGGPMVGPAGLVELRAALPGFRRLVASLVAALAVQDTERILDAGCGTGAVARWLGRHAARKTPLLPLTSINTCWEKQRP
jgi:hypothetical protein